ncbi:cell wall-active antibiotics response protein [Mucilaginibacter sp. HMF5004]|uniref:LiaF transmembrane domain-containing protein n=1 Tax=Mucilaginibacter rivuli TaxID=2857527 RepID=UPI001C5CDBA9|nr:LiaF domain-containing protein [Mucilaginibacter rivuli]MBW4888734.1 cell wall-active antibiotics response protein [Mucilaginibacter rivuli]
MSIDIDENNKGRQKSTVLAGAIFVAVGFIILINQLDFFFIPGWLFSWPMWVIAFAIFNGVKHNFRNSGWIIWLFVGIFFLIDKAIPHTHFANNFWPVIFIAIGIRMITNRNRPWDKDRWNKDRWKQQWKQQYNNPTGPVVDYTVPNDAETNTNTTDAKYNMGDDYLDAISIFAGAKKRVLSKDFKGGEIVNIFGGADIDLTQADINGRVIIEVTQVFGGIKLIVPPHWHVTSDMVTLFAGFDDKRMMKSDYGSDKILVLKGTSIFAGVDIRSY